MSGQLTGMHPAWSLLHFQRFEDRPIHPTMEVRSNWRFAFRIGQRRGKRNSFDASTLILNSR
jgi:hypothetical protein